MLSFDFSDYADCSVEAFLDGKLICRRDFSHYFAIDPETKTETEFTGAVPDCYTGTNGYAVTSGKYYSCVMSPDYTVTLYEIDCEHRSVTPLADYFDVSPMVYLWETPDGILQLKTPSLEANRRTYFDLFHPDTGETELVIQGQGNDYFAHASVYENTLYVLVSHRSEDGPSTWGLQAYDLGTYQLLKETSLEAVSAFLRQTRIDEMEVLGDYVYFANWSDQGIIAKISDEGVTPVVERESLRCASCFDRSAQTSERLFYSQPTDECLLFQFDTGETRIFRVERQEGFELWSVMIDGDRVLLHETQISQTKLENNKEIFRIFDYNDFISQGASDSD